jgi:hypothetical protein
VEFFTLFILIDYEIKFNHYKKRLVQTPKKKMISFSLNSMKEVFCQISKEVKLIFPVTGLVLFLLIFYKIFIFIVLSV